MSIICYFNSPVSKKKFSYLKHKLHMHYFLLGVLAPIILNLIHLAIGYFITKNQGNVYGVGFSAISFISKTTGMVFITWFGVAYVELDFRIFVPLLTFFWFLTHILEAFIINSLMKKNSNKSKVI
jgi:hypothetical protein